MKALVPLFKGASQLEVTAALRHFRPAKVDMNIPLMEEGDEDPSLIVVLDGELEVRCGPVELATARTGDLVGEVSLFTGARRTAAVRTLSPCKLLTLDRSGYEALAAAQNTVAYSLELDALAQLTRRLRRMLSLLVHPPGPRTHRTPGPAVSSTRSRDRPSSRAPRPTRCERCRRPSSPEPSPNRPRSSRAASLQRPLSFRSRGSGTPTPRQAGAMSPRRTLPLACCWT